MELHRGDPTFRDAVRRQDWDIVRRRHVRVDPAALRVLWDPECNDAPVHPSVEKYRSEGDQALAESLRDRARYGFGNRSYRNWRARQVSRYLSETDLEHSKSTPHIPFALELSDGCSIGCDYCCVAAGRLESVARFTPENGDLFRASLRALESFFGEGQQDGILYCATDPLDNRDYEKYVAAFLEQFGALPHTTTAAWYRNVPRTRRLLALFRSAPRTHRFSINSLEHLHFCMDQFTARELALVRLEMQHPEAGGFKVASGRGREADPDAVPTSGACVSGFLINLVERTIKLVSPTADLESWPLGYAVYAEGRFEDGDGLYDFMKACERDIMRAPLENASVPRFRKDLEIKSDPQTDDFVLSTEFAEARADKPIQTAILRSIDGHKSVGQIVRELMREHDPALLYHTFTKLTRSGLFEHVPGPEETITIPLETQLPVAAAAH